jgi:hypothetical protein
LRGASISKKSSIFAANCATLPVRFASSSTEVLGIELAFRRRIIEQAQAGSRGSFDRSSSRSLAKGVIFCHFCGNQALVFAAMNEISPPLPRNRHQ